jgi:hypothetical protein
MASQEQVQEEIERLNGLIVSGRYSEESIAWMRIQIDDLKTCSVRGISSLTSFRFPAIRSVANLDFAYEEERDREQAEKYGWDES